LLRGGPEWVNVEKRGWGAFEKKKKGQGDSCQKKGGEKKRYATVWGWQTKGTKGIEIKIHLRGGGGPLTSREGKNTFTKRAVGGG